MNEVAKLARAEIPSVDRLLHEPALMAMIAARGRTATVAALRQVLDDLRRALADAETAAVQVLDDAGIAARTAEVLDRLFQPSLRPIFNLTGTVLHTNLGRAALPEEAVAAIAQVARGASNLEFDLDSGRRGDRDSHVEALICRLTGAEAATVVNNNAAAVLLVLNTLAQRRRVPVSRGELIEIGGAFRMPDIMARAGCTLVEVGTTNRTHLKDYAEAIDKRTGLVMKVHRSNYAISGFTADVDERALAKLAHDHGIPFAVDLGSGTLVDLGRFGLPHEPTPAETIAGGADLVTFSTDKLLGGPQGGVIVGRRDLIARLKRNPLKRAMRCDKLTIAGLEAVLRLYLDPDRLTVRMPVLRHLARSEADVTAQAQRLCPQVATRLGGVATVSAVACHSQIGSGSMPVHSLPSAALALRPVSPGRKVSDAALSRLAAALRHLPLPIVGRIADGAVLLDLRCLDDEAAFLGQLVLLPGLPPADETRGGASRCDSL